MTAMVRIATPFARAEGLVVDSGLRDEANDLSGPDANSSSMAVHVQIECRLLLACFLKSKLEAFGNLQVAAVDLLAKV